MKQHHRICVALDREGFVVGLMALALISGVAPGVAKTARAAELAKVNSRSLTDQDVQNALNGLNEAQRKSILSDPVNKQQILAGVIDQEVLMQEAQKLRLDQEQDFKDALEIFRRNALVERLLRKMVIPKITDREVKKYYDGHTSLFSTDQVHAYHILLKTEAEAREVLKKARQEGADFQALAEKYSQDPSAKNNRGDLGFFTRDRMVAEFTDVAFGTPTNQVVGPVKTTSGYHIIKVVEKKSGKVLELADVEARAREMLRQELTRSYIDQLKASAKIEIHKAP